jgi:hypothetical protein
MRQKSQPEAWSTFDAMSVLGEMILRQERFEEAEKYLLDGYNGLKKRENHLPIPGRVCLREAALRVVKLYDMTNRPAKGREWAAVVPLEPAPNPRVTRPSQNPIPSRSGVRLTNLFDSAGPRDERLTGYLESTLSGQTVVVRSNEGIFSVPVRGGKPTAVVRAGAVDPKSGERIDQWFTGRISGPTVLCFGGTPPRPDRAGPPGGIYTTNGTGAPLALVADASTPVPKGTGPFTQFSPMFIAVSGRVVAFQATSAGKRQGIYAAPVGGGELFLVADTSTPIPGGTGTFKTLGNLCNDHDRVVFRGTGDRNREGIYAQMSRGGPLIRVIDNTASIPSGIGTFTRLGHAAVSGRTVAFYAYGTDNFMGLYTVPLDGGPVTPIADTNTAVPGGTGTFTQFILNESVSGSIVAFNGVDSRNARGVYTASTSGGPITKILAKGDTLDGKTVNDVLISKFALDGSYLVMTVQFESEPRNPLQGIYLADLYEN